jgi:hypothetical protein
MRDLIIGSITNYNVNQIRPWVESLKASGFSGDRYMVCYNIDYETVKYLKEHGFILKLFQDVPGLKKYTYTPSNNFHICVNRFFDMWNLLTNLPPELKNDYRFIISTDVGDVIFQSNPSIWLENNLKGVYKINAATESVYYKDEIYWGANNMKQSFGNEVYETVKENLIYNAGTISGRFQTIVDLFLVIWNMCQGFGTKNPDQAAYNLLLSLEPYKSITKFNMSEDGWAAQLGTSMVNKFEKLLVEKSPIYENEQIVTNKKKKPFVIVHQYNRLPHLKLKFV